MEDMEKLLYASPCPEFARTIRTASPQEKDEMRALAKYKAESLSKYFIEKLHYGGGPKAGAYAHDLAERALLLSEDPANFASVAEVLDSTCAILPHVPVDRFRELKLPLPSCGVVGLASNMMGPLNQRYRNIAAHEKTKGGISFLFFALLCVALAGFVLLHPISVVFFAGAWLKRGLVILGALGTIALLFTAGLWGAGIFLVAYAAVMSGLESLIPLGLLARIVLALIPAAGAVALFVGFVQGMQEKAAYRRAKGAAADLLEDAEDALQYFELCLTRLQAYHKWLDDHDVVEYPKVEKAEKYYRSARDWAKKFVRAFDTGF